METEKRFDEEQIEIARENKGNSTADVAALQNELADLNQQLLDIDMLKSSAVQRSSQYEFEAQKALELSAVPTDFARFSSINSREPIVPDSDLELDKQDPETGEPMRATLNIWKYEIYSDELKSSAGMVRLAHFALLLIMLIAAVAGGAPGAPFKFQILLALVGIGANAFFLVNDFSTSGPPDQIGSFKFTFARMVAYFALFLITTITSLAAWANNGDIGALQAAGAIGTLAGISFAITAFFSYQAHSEFMSAEAEKEAQVQHNEGNKTKAEKDSEGPPIDRTTKPNTISGNEFSDLHGQQHMEGDFNTLAHRSQMNSRELDYGDRIGYRGQMQYNEQYGDSHPQIMDNPQPLATLSHRNDGLQRGFQQEDMRGDPYGIDADPYGRDFSTLPRDQTLGHRDGFESHDNTDLQYPHDFQHDAMMLARNRAGFGDAQ